MVTAHSAMKLRCDGAAGESSDSSGSGPGSGSASATAAGNPAGSWNSGEGVSSAVRSSASGGMAAGSEGSAEGWGLTDCSEWSVPAGTPAARFSSSTDTHSNWNPCYSVVS